VNIEVLIIFLFSYIIGSIPFGLILTKIFLKKDIREMGSGNIGATNVLRTGKKLLAASTLLFDVAKGYLTIYLTQKIYPDLILLSGLICLIGHIFPVWLKFKGGKGVATYLGVVLALSFNLALVFSVSWLIVFSLTKYSSLSSILGSLNVFLFSFFSDKILPDFIFFIFFIIVVFTHRENILRLKNKTETKIKF